MTSSFAKAGWAKHPFIARRPRGYVVGMKPVPEKPFDVDAAVRLIREAVKPYPKAAMFELADEGFNSLFEQLVACIISIRTLEEVTLPTARKLFAAARTPEQVARLSPEEIDRLIHACTFHEPKARQIHAIADRVLQDYGGELPAERDVVLELPGIGPKCGNLALGIAAGKPFGVPVDIHVHRVTNRWGVVDGSTPEKTMVLLEAAIPRRYWLEINRLLVPFGKHVCLAKRPKCSTCPVEAMCQQKGVTAHQ